MADFLTTKAIASEIEEIIKRANEEIYILTPYLKLSNTFFERIQEAIEKGIRCTIIYGKSELQKKEESMLYELNCDILFKSDMHAKCYANEYSALITSMNLHSFSEANNREFGVLLNNNRFDKEAYQECISEIKSIISRAEVKKEGNFKHFVINLEEKEIEFFSKLKERWHKHLIDNYPDYKFYSENNNLFCNSFLSTKIDLSTTYGFITVNLKGNYEFLKRKREIHTRSFEQVLSEYRFFWNRGDQMCIYASNDFKLKNIDEGLLYYTNGLKILYRELVEKGII